MNNKISITYITFFSSLSALIGLLVGFSLFLAILFTHVFYGFYGIALSIFISFLFFVLYIFSIRHLTDNFKSENKVIVIMSFVTAALLTLHAIAVFFADKDYIFRSEYILNIHVSATLFLIVIPFKRMMRMILDK